MMVWEREIFNKISAKKKEEVKLDFLLQKRNQIIGVEVKKGKHVKSRSLSVFVNAYKPAYAIRLSLKNFGEKDGLKSVPLYAAFCV